MNLPDLIGKEGEKQAFVIDRKDNVAVMLCDIRKGEKCTVRMEHHVEEIVALEDIPFGHKIALTFIGQDESVFKYGEEIGKMRTTVDRGGWIHSHNMYCERGMKRG